MSLRNQRGFSLVEMAVVVLIGGLILAFSTPSINRYLVEARLRDSANRIAGEMRLARQKAVSNNSRMWFWTSANINYYYVGEQRWQGGASYGGLTWRGPFYLPSTVRVINPNWGGTNYFVYTPDGRPTASGSMSLVSLSADPDTIRINVDLSGSVWK